MFTSKTFRRFCLGALTSVAVPLAAIASEVEAQDGEVKIEGERGDYSGGQYQFRFHYHPEADSRALLEEGLPFDTSGGAVEINSVDLFQKYRGEELIEAPEFQALQRQSARGGVAAAFSDMVLFELAVLQKNCVANGEPIANSAITPVYSNIRLHTNPIRGNAVFNVFSYKEITCTENGNLLTIPLKRRWVISALRGLEQRDITKTITFVDASGNTVQTDMTYMMSAGGKDLRLMAYYSNLTLSGDRYEQDMKLVSAFDEFGNVDPRNKYYRPHEDSCLDIVFKNKPTNDHKIWSSPTSMLFCARGCIPGDVSATK
ncbi:hypothetical protein [Ruegeria sp. HKCCD7255]|uniref:hypothetical protein n=1 Tax=Ruegeria sp. HKCCD7255 TaxID=2683004 RepID=UPI0014892FC2|nr:hypothetical protein [Ruegeria sp. HKCCD7255]